MDSFDGHGPQCTAQKPLMEVKKNANIRRREKDMAEKTYNNKTDRKVKLSENFTASEFMCKCGKCVESFIDTLLVERLQKMRTALGKPVHINSGYRCPAHNKAVNGAANSNHVKGTAADIKSNGVSTEQIARLAEETGFKGIIRYIGNRNFVHVDTRTAKYFAVDNNGKITVKSTFGGSVHSAPARTLRMGAKGDDVKWLQQKLDITVDGIFGPKTESAVIRFQRLRGLIQDGIVGPKTREVLDK